MFDLCAPALIYVAFSLTQIVIDTYKGLYNTSLVKLFVMVMITILLNALCKSGMSAASWLIVFIPFVMMSIISSVLLYIFGLNAKTGTFNKQLSTSENENESANANAIVNEKGDIVVYDPNYDEKTHPVYYKSPNIIIPAPQGISQNMSTQPLATSTSVSTFTLPSLSAAQTSSGGAFKWV